VPDTSLLQKIELGFIVFFEIITETSWEDGMDLSRIGSSSAFA